MSSGFLSNILNSQNTTHLEVPVPDYIPYACHYDPQTLLTKNGELLQIITITGFSYETVGSQQVGLRDTVRKALIDHIHDTDYAVWFHTIRRKMNLDSGGDFGTDFCKQAHSAWVHKNHWHDKFVNELYITILKDAPPVSIKNHKDFFRSFWFKSLKASYEKELAQSCTELTETVNHVLKTLKPYGARKLGLIEKPIGTCSELLRFIGKIMHLAEKDMPLPLLDLSNYLATHRIAFGNNTLEVIGETGKHFGAILSVKEYHETSLALLDRILQLPIQFIISQSMDFINNKEALKNFEYQDYILTLSEDKMFRDASGIKDIIDTNQDRRTDYGEHQLTILLLEDTIPQLDAEIERAIQTLDELGIGVIREDMFLESTFWSQLPGNFSFIQRRRPINTARIAGFASLHNFPAGKRYDNHWGDAVTLFRTAQGTPYFFNFHTDDVGHTTIIGPFGAGKTVLTNFLVAESRKFTPHLFFIDQYCAAHVFMHAIGGEYVIISPHKRSTYTMNPLLLPDNSYSRDLLQTWLQHLLVPLSEAAPDGLQQKIQRAVEYLFTLPNEKRRLVYLAHHFGTDEEQAQEGTARHRFAQWYGDGKYASLFDHAEDTFPWKTAMWGVGISDIVKEKEELLAPVMSYILYHIDQALDGTPAMVVVDEAWEVFDNKVFAPQLVEWLDHLREYNAIALLATESLDNASESEITHALFQKIATQIYLTNPDATEAYKDVFKLTDKQFGLLKSMSAINRHFLLKHGNDALVAELNLTGLDAILSVLSGSEESVEIMQQIKEEKGDDLDAWLPLFYEKMGVAS